MNADSVKAKLKNYARESGRSFQEALVYYGLERTIYRISVSEYADHFVLKGGIFLYAIFEKTMHPIALSDAINLLKIFSKPLFNEQTCKVVKWNHSAGSWE